MSFPFLENLPAAIGKKFFLGKTLWDKGAKPYIAYKSGAAWNVTVGSEQWKTFQYQNDIGKRAPVSILGLEVKAGGANGTLRKAEVTIQFPNIQIISEEPWSNYFRIGNSAAVIWGWSYSGSGNGDFGNATNIYNNIKNWRAYCENKNYEHDILVGLMTDFEIEYNNNGTVNVTFTISSPNELPGTLKISKADGENLGAFSSDGKKDKMHEVLNAIKYGGEDDAIKKTIEANSVNYNLPWVDLSYGNSEEPYIRLETCINSIVNNFKTLENQQHSFSVGIDMSVARGHRNMISISENIIFPNNNAPGFRRKSLPDESRQVIPTMESVQDLTILSGGEMVNFPSPTPITLTGPNNNKTYDAYSAGWLKNVYIQTTWVSETLKTCDTIHQWLEKICDEINYASCGLMELTVDEVPNSGGILFLTIIDQNLTQKNEEANVFSINPRGEGTSILELKLNTDLPKGLAAQAVLGPNQSKENTGGIEGTNLFAKKNPDAIIGVYTKNQEEGRAKAALKNAGKAEPTQAEIDAQIKEEKAKEKKESEEAKKKSSEAGFMAKIWNGLQTFLANTFNVPSEAQVKIKVDSAQWVSSGYSGIGDGWGQDIGNAAGTAVYPIFKNREAISNILAGRSADADAPFDGTSVITNSEIELKCLGFSGLKNGYKMKVEGVPFGMNDKGYFQLTEVGHSVDATKWETSVKAKWRIVRK